MNKHLCALLTFVIMLPLAGCASPTPAPTATPLPTNTPIPTATLEPTPTLVPTPSISGEIIDDIDQYLTKLSGEYNLFNGIALVAKDGQVVLHKAYGLANREEDIPLELDALMLFWDAGMVSSAVLLLQEQGMLSLEDPICKFLSDCPDTWSGITIKNVLYQRSGIPNPYVGLNPVDSENLWGRADREDELIRLARELPLETISEPSSTIWSPTNFSVLVKIIESASGKTAQNYLKESLLTPLGIKSIGQSYKASDIKAIGYTNYRLPVTSDPLPDDLVFPSLTFANVHDMYLLLQEYLTPRVLTKSVTDFLWDDDIYHYGTGIVLNSIGVVNVPDASIPEGYGTWSFETATEGYTTSYLISPEDQVIIIVSGNEKDRDYIKYMKVIKDKLTKD